MYSRIETITPEIAREYLLKNNNNRNIRKGVVSKYATDMRNGDWQLSPQGISFYENGYLADGQHRLEAIILANCPVEMFVTYDVPKECTIQDRCAARSTSDVLKMGGLISSAASYAGVAIANFLFRIAGKSSVSEGTLTKFINDYEKYICDALSISNTRVNGTQLARIAPISTAVFCALYCGLQKEDLIHFVKVVNSGFYESANEQSAIVLRNFLIQNYTGDNSAERKYAFAVATNAIRDFAGSVPRKKAYRADVEPAFWKYVKKSVIDKYIEK